MYSQCSHRDCTIRHFHHHKNFLVPFSSQLHPPLEPKRHLFFVCLFVCLFFNLLTVPRSMRDLSSPFREWTHTLCIRSAESQPLDCQEGPKATNLFLNHFRVAWSFLKFSVHRTLQYILYFTHFIWHNIWESFMSFAILRAHCLFIIE